MCRILFTHSYFLRLDKKQWKTAQPYAPLGTLYAAALMRDKGYEVALHDTQFTTGPEEFAQPLQQYGPRYVIIYDDGFNYLTKMCLTNMREAAFTMIRMARLSGSKVIVSSSDAADHYEQYLQQGADFVLLGEAEYTLAELVDTIERGSEPFLSIAGLAYRDGDAVIKTAKRPVIRELDDLPLPAWDLVNFRQYRAMWQRSKGYFSINVGTTRGCPFKCNWCAKPIYGNRYNALSPQRVIEQLMHLQQFTSFEHVWFCDDIFGLKPGWVNEFAALAEANRLNLRFKIQSRADLLVQENYVLALKRAGCEEVWMGAESGSQKILDAMDKGTTIHQIEAATLLLKQHGIQACFFIQFGYSGETAEDIRSTINMIRRFKPDQIGISVSYPLPGTVFYEKVRSQMEGKYNWSDSDDLALMFTSTYSPGYYKQLHRYVHQDYRKRLALGHWRQLFGKPLYNTFFNVKKVLGGILLIPLVFVSRLKLQQLEKS